MTIHWKALEELWNRSIQVKIIKFNLSPSPLEICQIHNRKDLSAPQCEYKKEDWVTESFSFQNDVSEKEQRWGAKTVEGSGRQEAFE
jgi:hypothetical protein